MQNLHILIMFILHTSCFIALHDLDLVAAVLALREREIGTCAARRKAGRDFVGVVVEALVVLSLGGVGRDAKLGVGVGGLLWVGIGVDVG